MLKKDLDTPCLLVDYEVMLHNIEEMAAICRKENVALRPHIKTHKSPDITAILIEKGAQGITTATLGEAEVMAAAGIDDILVAYPIVGKRKLERLLELNNKIKITVGVDSFAGAKGLSDFAVKNGTQSKVSVIINSGLNRDGILPDQSGFALVSKINALPGLKITGIFTHEGHVQTADNLAEAVRNAVNPVVAFAKTLKDSGIDVVVSVGSTVTSPISARIDGVAEVRPGTYVFNDINVVKTGAKGIEDCALTVLATVVSLPSEGRFIIDAGSKTLSADLGFNVPDSSFKGYGFIKNLKGAVIERLSEEHGVVTFADGSSDIRIGDRLEIIPNHVCPVVNLFDEINVFKGEEVIKRLPVKARGRVQ